MNFNNLNFKKFKFMIYANSRKEGDIKSVNAVRGGLKIPHP